VYTCLGVQSVPVITDMYCKQQTYHMAHNNTSPRYTTTTNNVSDMALNKMHIIIMP